MRGPARLGPFSASLCTQFLRLKKLLPRAARSREKSPTCCISSCWWCGGGKFIFLNLAFFFRGPEFAITASLHWRRAADWTLERWSSTSKSLGLVNVWSERSHPSPPACTRAFPSSMTQLSFTVVCRLCRITSFHVRFRLEDEREMHERVCLIKVAAAPGLEPLGD